MNSYPNTYVTNNPLKYTDPSGYKKLTPFELERMRENEAGYKAMMSFLIDWENRGSGGGHDKPSQRYYDIMFENGMYVDPLTGKKRTLKQDRASGRYYYWEYRGQVNYEKNGENYCEAIRKKVYVEKPKGKDKNEPGFLKDFFSKLSVPAFIIHETAQSTKNLDKIVTNVTKRSSKIIGAINVMLSADYLRQDGDLSWGDWSQIGLDGFFYFVSWAGWPGAIIGIGYSVSDEIGVFDEWHSEWDWAEKMLNDYGFTFLPLNYPGTFSPVFIQQK